MVNVDELKSKGKEAGERAAAWGKNVYQKLSDDLDRVEFLKKVEETTHAPKVALVGGALVLVLLLFLTSTGGRFICNLASFILPAYSSFRSIETNDRTGTTTWLAYWIVVSGLGLLDMVNEYVTYWIPFYYLVKFAFILYLVLPQTRGVTVLRELVIKAGSKLVARSKGE